jgi:hypothetical protein
MAFDLSEHFRKKAEHHKERVDQHMDWARLNKTRAEHHDATDPLQAQFHRDEADLHKAAAVTHSKMQRHYEAQREQLAAGSGADVFDSRESSSRELQDIGKTNFRKACGLLED